MFCKIKYWFKNYWYYYKWGVIIGTAFIAIILICVFQSAGKEKYDANIIYVGPHIFAVNEKSSISSALEQIMDDYNKDGKKVVDIVDMTAFTDEQIRDAIGESPSDELLIKYAPYTVDRVKTQFSNVIAGDGYICLLDQYWYDILKDASALVPLSEVLGYEPENMLDEYSVLLSDLDLYSYFNESVGRLPSDTIVCFRVMPTTSAFTGVKEARKMYGYSMELFKAMFAFEAP